MDLILVDPQDYKSVITTTLRTFHSPEEVEDLYEGFSLELDEGSHLYTVREADKDLGFILVTPLSEDEFEDESIDLIRE